MNAKLHDGTPKQVKMTLIGELFDLQGSQNFCLISTNLFTVFDF